MRTDAFGGAPTAPAAPTPPAADAPGANASPPAQSLNQPAASDTPPVTAPASPPASQTVPDQPAAPAPATEAPKGKSAKGKKEAHMPPVGNVTKDNPTGAPAAGHNSAAQDEAMQGVLATVEQLGTAAGQGANSLGELAVAVCSAAKAGIISVADRVAKGDGGTDDVALIYAKYREAKNKATVDHTADKDQADKDQNQINALRIFAKLGAADWKGNAPMLLAKARSFINDKLTREETGKSSYTSLKVYARAQLKAIRAGAVKGGKSEAKPLTNDEIRDLLSKGGPVEDTRGFDEFVRDELAATMKKIVKLRDGSDERAGFDNPDVDRAYELLNRVKLQLDKKLTPAEGADE